jgi:uncharacterized protein YqjF (DUF2071 family)
LPGPILLGQTWRDIVFVHWPVAALSVRGLFPDRTEPDTFDGQTYVADAPDPAVSDAPVGVLWSPGLHAQFGRPARAVR